MTTKELLAKSFVELSNVKSVDKITIRNIVDNCGLTKTTFYNHFQDKYDLIVQIYAAPVRNIVKRIGNNYSFCEAIVDFLNYFADNRRFIINALKNTSGQNSFLCNVSQIHVTALRELICSTLGSKELPLRVETLLKLYVFGTVHLVCEWLIDKMPIPIEEFATVLAAGLPSELKQYLPERVDLTN